MRAAPPAPTISPLPGTPDANPDTQISILGPAPRTIKSVSVIGSVSGAHRGRLESYRGVIGASFVLDHPLTQGEHVRVTVRIKGRNATRQSFTVARLGAIQPVLNAHKLQPSKLQHFVSQPNLLAPMIKIRKHAKLDGDIFLTPLPSPIIHPESNNELTIDPVGPGGPMIIAPNGRLVWFDQVAPPDVATNFRIQRYLGHRVLTWWQGGVTPSAFGLGEGVIADGSYATLRTVKTGNGYQADLHEFLLTGGGEALFTIYSPVLVHLPGTKPDSLTPLLDSLVQEVDIRTGLVVWEWHGLGHIPASDSYATTSTSASYDVYHLNSIQVLAHGQLLVSARDTSAIYDIDRATGRIVWTLGGKASTFRLGRGARFYFQHDAQLLRGDRVSLFDDEGGPPRKATSSRGLGPRPERASPHRNGRAPVRAYRRGHAGRQRGKPAEPRRREQVRGVWIDSVLLRVLAHRQGAVRRQPADRRWQLPGVPVSMAGDAAHSSGDRRPTRVGLARLDLRQLERRHDGGALAAPRRR